MNGVATEKTIATTIEIEEQAMLEIETVVAAVVVAVVMAIIAVAVAVAAENDTDVLVLAAEEVGAVSAGTVATVIDDGIPTVHLPVIASEGPV